MAKLQVPCRWSGWRPKQPAPEQLRQLLLFRLTRSTLAGHFPVHGLQPASAASKATAEAVFLRLLCDAQSSAQFRALQALLEEVWDSGHAFVPLTEQLAKGQDSTLYTGSARADVVSKEADHGSAAAAAVSGAELESLPRVASVATARLLEDKSPGSAPGTPPAEESRWGATSAVLLGAVDGWDDADELLLPEDPPGPPTKAAPAAEGWDSGDDRLGFAPEPLPVGSAVPKQSQQVHGSDSRQEAPGSGQDAGTQAAGAAAVDGWASDENLDLSSEPQGAQRAATAHGAFVDEEVPSVRLEQTARSNGGVPSGRGGDAVAAASLSAAFTQTTESSHFMASPKHGNSSPITCTNKPLRGEAAAKVSLRAGPRKVRRRSPLAAKLVVTSRTEQAQDQLPEKEAAVPMHACWAALLQRMLKASNRKLAGAVLTTLEKAGLQGAVLVSEAEAGDVVAAAGEAGKMHGIVHTGRFLMLVYRIANTVYLIRHGFLDGVTMHAQAADMRSRR